MSNTKKNDHPFLHQKTCKDKCPFCGGEILSRTTKEDLIANSRYVVYKYDCDCAIETIEETINGPLGKREHDHVHVLNPCSNQDRILLKLLTK